MTGNRVDHLLDVGFLMSSIDQAIEWSRKAIDSARGYNEPLIVMHSNLKKMNKYLVKYTQPIKKKQNTKDIRKMIK